jgi:S-adenosylmethionine hydrolase
MPGPRRPNSISPPPPPPPPIVTLTTDFGITDSYVAEMKAVLLARCPAARVVDVTHLIPPQDVRAASVTLDRCLRIFPPGTIHLAVVDPGVGTARKLLLVEIAGQLVLCPDNGLITWPWRRALAPAIAHQLSREAIRPRRGRRGVGSVRGARSVSPTFHGRDLLAPATGPHPARATVIHLDHFGNVTTNVPADLVTDARRIRLGRRSLGPIRQTYADVPIGHALALIGSSGLLEIAIRNGHAANALKLKPGDQLTIDY